MLERPVWTLINEHANNQARMGVPQVCLPHNTDVLATVTLAKPGVPTGLLLWKPCYTSWARRSKRYCCVTTSFQFLSTSSPRWVSSHSFSLIRAVTCHHQNKTFRRGITLAPPEHTWPCPVWFVTDMLWSLHSGPASMRRRRDEARKTLWSKRGGSTKLQR